MTVFPVGRVWTADSLPWAAHEGADPQHVHQRGLCAGPSRSLRHISLGALADFRWALTARAVQWFLSRETPTWVDVAEAPERRTPFSCTQSPLLTGMPKAVAPRGESSTRPTLWSLLEVQAAPPSPSQRCPCWQNWANLLQGRNSN